MGRSKPTLLLWLLILLYVAYFSGYAIQRHQTLNSYTADLSLIDQPLWNTLHGRFMEVTWGARQQPRLAEHFEPLLIPLAAVFWLWDDVRALLVLQTLALALGALPVFWLARQVFHLALRGDTARRAPTWVALAFAAAYLLSTHLQAANVADVHADPFIVTPLLFTFWYARQRRWGWMWLWAILTLLVKENLATLGFTFGLYLFFAERPLSLRPLLTGQRRHALALMGLSLTWFVVATFLIVAPLARTYFGSDGPVYLANRFNGDLGQTLSLLARPERLRYLLGLLAPTGFLALLAPEVLVVGLPVLLANMLSNFPGQFSGEQHYSAPLVSVFTVAAILGAARIVSLLYGGLARSSPPSQPPPAGGRRSASPPAATAGRTGGGRLPLTFRARRTLLPLVTLWLLAFSLTYHYLYGWTPLSRRAERFTATAHTRLAPRFLAQIPAEVPISASPALHPHLAHRPLAYAFPLVQEAKYVLVDVSDVPGAHPNDVRAKIEELLAGGWSLLDAADGFILLKKSQSQISNLKSQTSLPPAFYTFAWADEAAPQHPRSVNFAGAIHFLGFDVIDQPFHRQTRLRLYWQASQPLPEGLRLWPVVFDDFGQPLTDPILQPPVATVWYPPERWQPGQFVVTELLPQNYGERFHLGVAVVLGDFNEPAQRAPILSADDLTLQYDGDTWAQVGSFRREGWGLTILSPQAVDAR
ncbi:MAG: DUF2079 domain-containing protein [Anaerolineae bacterium]